MKETLRRHPTVAGTLRKCDKEQEIGGYKIPANSLIMVHNFLAIACLFELSRFQALGQWSEG